MASREAVLWAYAYLGHAYPMEAPTAEELEVWLDVLDDVDDAALRQATRAWCKSDSSWPPKPGQLRVSALSGTRTYLDRSHREYESATAGELGMTYPDPVAAIKALKETYDAKYRPNLRVVNGDEQ